MQAKELTWLCCDCRFLKHQSTLSVLT